MLPDPILEATPGMWDGYTVECPWVIRENGEYLMWYIGGSSFPAPYLGHASSPDGIHWSKFAGNPVLGPGTEVWEAGGVGPCSVLPMDEGYKMWYFGATIAAQYGQICLGYATSTDGKSWLRDTLHNPILVPGASGSWDGYWAADPRVLFHEGVYYMWYTGADAMFSHMQLGLATSTDGVTNWIKHPDNPVLRPSPGEWDGGGVECGIVLVRGDTLYMWYDGSPIQKLWQIGLAKSQFTAVSVGDGGITIPGTHRLLQNYPNPINPTTTITYELPKSSHVRVSVYDILGREVSVLVNERRDAGVHEVKFDGSGLSSGVYLYRLTAGSFVETRKLVLVR